MTKAQRDALATVRVWCRHRKIALTSTPRHLHPRAFVVGYAAPGCLIVARPWLDSEPQVRKFDKASPLTTIRHFDNSLKAGDWCITAYVTREGCQETIAVPLPEPTR